MAAPDGGGVCNPAVKGGGGIIADVEALHMLCIRRCVRGEESPAG
jgi:hypothetical protein